MLLKLKNVSGSPGRLAKMQIAGHQGLGVSRHGGSPGTWETLR